MTNCFVEVEESSKCITFSLGTCLSSIGFQVRYLTCASVLRASQVASIGCNCLWFDKKTVILHRKPRAGKNVKPVTHHHILLVRRSWMNPLPQLGAVCAEPNHATRCFSLASASLIFFGLMLCCYVSTSPLKVS